MKKRLIFTSIISIILITVLMIGSTYSLFVTSNVDDNTNVYKSGNLNISSNLNDTNNGNITFTSKVPVSNDDARRIKPYQIVVTNTGNVPYKFNIILENDTATNNSIATNYIMTKVGQLEPKKLSDCENGVIKEDIIVPANDNVVVDVRVYLSEFVQNSEMDKNFSAKLAIDGLAIYNENDEIDNSILSLPKTTLVKFNPNNGVLTGEESKELESSSSYGEMPQEPVRIGYTFDGWYTEKEDGNKVLESTKISDVSEDDHTLYARWIANLYTLSLNVNNGAGWTAETCNGEFLSMLQSNCQKIVTYGEKYGSLPIPTRENYIFIGWFTKADGGQLVTSSNNVLLAENHTLYAHWSEDGYVVNLDTNAPDVNIETSTVRVVKGEKYVGLPIPTRTGYTFDGWYTDPNSGTLITENTTVEQSEPHILYAHWSPLSTKVTFNSNGCGTASPSSKNVSYGEKYSTLATVNNCTGKNFLGWYTDPNGGTQITEDTTVSATTDQTLYAHWSNVDYTVTFNVNGGDAFNSTTCSGTGINFTSPNCTKTVNYGVTYNTLPTPTRTGYTFTGWYTASSGGTLVTESTNVLNASNHTLFARWNINSYTITINPGAGISSIEYSGWTTNASNGSISKSFNYNEKIDFRNYGSVTYKNGYDGLSITHTSGLGNLLSYVFNVGDGDATLTLNATTLASPVPSISGGTTKIYGSSSTTLTASQSTTYDSGVTIYYNFGYTATSSSTCGTTYTYGTASTTATKSITSTEFYGRRCYKVKAYAKGEGDITSETIESSSSTTLTLTGAKMTLNANSCGTISGTSPFYAKYNTSSTYTTSYGTTAATKPTVSKTGYTFNGWYTASSGGSKVLDSTGTLTGTAVSGYSNSSSKWVATANKTLYAQCSVNTYTVTYNCGTGASNCPSQQTRTYGDTEFKLSSTIPTKTGYEFLGWSKTQNDTESDYAAGASYTTNESLPLYAVWGYKVMFNTSAQTGLTAELPLHAEGYLSCGVGTGTTCTIELPNMIVSDSVKSKSYIRGWGLMGMDSKEDPVGDFGEPYTVTKTTTLYGYLYDKNYCVLTDSIDEYYYNFNTCDCANSYTSPFSCNEGGKAYFSDYINKATTLSSQDDDEINIKLLAGDSEEPLDENTTVVISSNQNITIDLNNHYLEFAASGRGNIITNNGTLHITNSNTGTDVQSYLFSAGGNTDIGSLIVNNGTLTISKRLVLESSNTTNTTLPLIKNSGTMYVGINADNPSATSNSGTSPSMPITLATPTGYVIENTSTGTVNFYVGTGAITGGNYTIKNSGAANKVNLYGGRLYYNPTTGSAVSGDKTVVGSWATSTNESATPWTFTSYVYTNEKLTVPRVKYSYRKN